MSPSTSTFHVDAVLFDMDGTLTDSIAAVEAAWGKVAKDIGQDPHYVIAATHGKRAVDNLSQFKPHIPSHEMDAEVQAFEETILYFADAYNKHGPGSQTNSPWPSQTPMSGLTPADSNFGTPDLTPGSSAPSSRPSSRAPSMSSPRRPSFGTRLGNMLSMTVMADADTRTFEDPIMEDVHEEMVQQEREGGLSGAKSKLEELHERQAWQIEAASVDRSVQILPGVKRMMDSIPAGHYAVATSGAKTYAYGCMTRVGITPPPVTITADDKRLKAGKPAPDPFLLAAECLGFDAKRCVVFEDSPSGIRAGVTSGATVVAVCTSHERKKIENCGAHYIVDNMEKIRCIPEQIDGQTRLRFEIEA
ncbi:HAD-like protein [Amylostereum chailletii]|nr:HAD-like protein [Amylostereum chailletii]